MTGRFVTFALERRLVDIPNERSSHSRVTPRGGGVSFVVLFLVATVLLGMLRGLPIGLPIRLIAALLAGAGVAFVGYLDDCNGLSIKLRLLVQLAATAITLFLICGNPFQTFHYPVALIAAGSVAAVILYTWLINLVNFMDGIDGLAASGAVCISGSCCLLLLMRHGSDEISFLFGILACAVLGFLFWNWPGAHIFMGDAGSYFLGFSIGALMLLGIVRHELGLWVVPILMGVFFIDSSATVFHRMRRGERWYKPHRLHGFQHAADVFGHRTVTLSVMVINLFWLVPLAVLADTHPRYGFALLLLAWSPIVLLSYLFHSGEVLTARAIPRWRSVVLIANCTPKNIGLRFAAHVRRLGPARVSWLRVLMIAGLSAASTCAAAALHMGMINPVLSPRLMAFLGLFTFMQVAVFLAFGVHRYHWHLMSREELPNIVGGCLVATLAGVIVAMAVVPEELGKLPASVFVVQTAFLAAHIVLIRMIAAGFSRASHPPGKQSPAKRVVIYGANNLGLELFSNLRRLVPDYRVVGFVDPRRSMKGISIAGGRVLGVDSDIRKIATTYNIDDVLVSSATACSPAGGRFLQQCRDAAVDVRIVPSNEYGLEDGTEAKPMWASKIS
jgi:Fuc2NAc and GlcNAc transferase